MNINRTATLAALASAVIVMSMVPHTAKGQGLARRVSQVRDGKVRLTFAARPDVCGYGNGISRGPNNRMNWSSSNESADVIYDDECSHSPVRLVLSVDGGSCRPILNVTRIPSNRVDIDWTTAAPGYLLERTNVLRNPSPAWPVVPGTPSMSGGRFHVIDNIALSPTNSFYRLRKP